MSQTVLVLDFGGQYKELIARSVRNLGVYSVIKPASFDMDEIRRLNPVGIILTGGPDSVYDAGAAGCGAEIFSLGIPVLGICYGMQLMCHRLGGTVTSGNAGEYGRVGVLNRGGSELLYGVKERFFALMSHRDVVSATPAGFRITAHTDTCIAAVEDAERKRYGVQFHPETAHTDCGKTILHNFLYRICGADGDYRLDDYIGTETERIRARVGGGRVLLGLSGGVDSSVCAALLARAVPDKLVCVFVDHGLMRQNEGDEVERAFRNRKLKLIRVNAEDRFLKRLKGIVEPEQKRKMIGEEFVRVFEEEAAKLGHIPFLAQGTIYPDIVESGGAAGATIKSHHNVGGMPDSIAFSEIIEPLRGLFKDEVRVVGQKLGLPRALVERQPFPGPGLAIRIAGEVTKDKLNTLRHADAIVRAELAKLRKRPDQYFAVLTDTCAVGVKGDGRTYDPVVAVRAVETDDFMTCSYARISHAVLSKISARITSEVAGVGRVVYDITDKPPATVEWE